MEVEFLDFDRRNAWGEIFQECRNESSKFPYSVNDAKKSENKKLNRYRNVYPFDHSRVHLQRGEGDYINASFVNVASADRSYILTQGPLPATTGHFWLMIWEQKSKAILMLNRVIENNAVKCHQYWPIGVVNGGDEEIILMDVGLKVKYISQKKETNYIVREFVLTDLESQDSRKVLQFHYMTWPDFGVPESPAAFLNFLFDVRKSGVLNTNVGPAVVHCSAGIGRSGTFCLIDSCLVLIEKNNDKNSVDIRQLLLEMRHCRKGLVQRPDQLRFSYLAILEGAKRAIPNKIHPNPMTYENVIQHNVISRSSEVNEENIFNNNHYCEPNNTSFPIMPCGLDLTLKTAVTKCNDRINSTRILEVQDATETKLARQKSLKRKFDETQTEANHELSSINCRTKNIIPDLGKSLQQESLGELRKHAREEQEDNTAA